MESIKQPKKSLRTDLIIFPLYFYRFAHTQFGKTTGFCQKVSLSPNRIRFSLFSSITTTFSDKEIHLSAKIHNILFLFTFFRHTIPETPDFCRKVYFCQIVSIATLTAASKIQKKRGSPATPVNPSTLKNPWFQAISLHFRQIVPKSYGIISE